MIILFSNRTITICTPFPNATTSKIYVKYNVVMKSLTYYIIPLLIIASFYILMAIKLRASAKEMPGENKGAQGAIQARARKNVARMVLIFIFREYFSFLKRRKLFEGRYKSALTVGLCELFQDIRDIQSWTAPFSSLFFIILPFPSVWY